MKEGRVERLVRELLAIYLKYGAPDFERAIRALDSGDATSLITRAASRLNKASDRIHSRQPKLRKSHGPSKSQERGFGSFVQELQKHEDKEVRGIAEFVDAIAHRKTLRTAAQLREFTNMLGISYRKLDRVALAKQIGRYLMDLRPTDLQSVLGVARQIENRQSSLQEWSNVIVKGN